MSGRCSKEYKHLQRFLMEHGIDTSADDISIEEMRHVANALEESVEKSSSSVLVSSPTGAGATLEPDTSDNRDWFSSTMVSIQSTSNEMPSSSAIVLSNAATQTKKKIRKVEQRSFNENLLESPPTAPVYMNIQAEVHHSMDWASVDSTRNGPRMSLRRYSMRHASRLDINSDNSSESARSLDSGITVESQSMSHSNTGESFSSAGLLNQTRMGSTSSVAISDVSNSWHSCRSNHQGQTQTSSDADYNETSL